MSKRCSSVTVSLIPFLSIDIQPVSLVIYARFLYHYGITTLSQAIWMEIGYLLLLLFVIRYYTDVYKRNFCFPSKLPVIG